MCVYVNLCACVYVCRYLLRPEEDIGCPGAGDAGSYEHDMGNETKLGSRVRTASALND